MDRKTTFEKMMECWMDRKIYGQKKKYMKTQLDGWIDRKNRRMAGWMNRKNQMDTKMEEWMDSKKNR